VSAASWLAAAGCAERAAALWESRPGPQAVVWALKLRRKAAVFRERALQAGGEN